MLYCTRCGQCIHISDSNFIQVNNTTGWESYDADPESGEMLDYIEGETTESDFSSLECPNCSSNDVDMEWGGTEEEALEARHQYTNGLRELAARREIKKVKEKPEWDSKENEYNDGSKNPF